MKADAISGFATALEAHIPGTRVGGAALLMVSTPGVPNIDSGGGNTTTSGGNTTFTGIDPNGM